MIRVTCLGGVGSVTGSNYLIETPSGKGILVDCGMFQGGSEMERRNWEPWAFDPRYLETLFLTHAHIDHSGRIPKLYKDGFRGKIITSAPTAELCEIMLLDAAHIQEMDAEWRTRKNRRRGKGEIAPLYTSQDAEASLRLLSPLEKDRIILVEEGVKARLRNAGHILGSSILELWIEEEGQSVKIVFSGDLGKKDQLIVQDPHEVFDADYLFLESTYGNRRHRSFEESKKELLEAIRYSYEKGEKTMIPAFAVERTQEILYVLAEFQREGLLPDIPIYLDSPLAIKATEIFRKNKSYYDDEAKAIVDKGLDPFHMPNLRFTLSTRDSMAINERMGPAIVIAGNGMCTAGRIKHHFKHNLWREGSSIVFVGYQAEGTTGRKIIDGAKQIRNFGEMVSVRSKVFTIGGFSAHADQDDLLDWVSHFESTPKVFLVHGEKRASEPLAKEIEARFGLSVHIPVWKERVILKPREVAYEMAPAEKEVQYTDAVSNAILDLENELKRLRKAVKESKTGPGEEELNRLRYMKEELEAIRGLI
jgi:metallo-beta-lactamase family protein